jgi:hypothetical protein
MGYELPYKQCKLRLNDEFQTAWLPLNGCRKGAYVELKADQQLWEVVEVYEGEITAQQLRENQRLNKNSLKSIL